MIALPCLVLLAAAAPPASAPSAAPDPAAPAAAPAVEPALPDAEPIGFHARADKASVRLGEPFGYSVEIRHAPDERYVPHPPVALEPFQVHDLRCRSDQDRGASRTTCTMRLALFTLGEVDVPELVFDVQTAKGKARLAVPGPRIEGAGVIDESLPADSVALRDVASPVPLLVRSYRLLWWALGVLGAAACVAGVVLALRRRRRRAPPELTPAERFARRIATIEAERLPLLGLGAEHVSRLSEAVREYVGTLSGAPALDLTSAELLSDLRASPVPQLDLQGLERFLADADLVKFARRPAGLELCQEGTDFAKALLERTRPAIAPPGAGPEGAPPAQPGAAGA